MKLKGRENNMKTEPPHIPSKSNGFENRAHSAFSEEIIAPLLNFVNHKNYIKIITAEKP
jgi:hypothetical protein